MLFDLYSNDKNKENINKSCLSIGALDMLREFARDEHADKLLDIQPRLYWKGSGKGVSG